MKQLIVNPSGTLKKAVLRRLLAAGITVLAMTFAIPSCTDKFGDIEVNLIAGSADSVASLETAKGMMLEAMPLIHDLREHSFQYQRNLHIDNYSGYLCVANNLEGRLPSTYFLNSDFESGPIYAFLRIIRQVVPVMNSAERLNFPELGAIATVIFCYASQELTDIHGPMPYADFRKLKENPPMHYMPVKDIYYDIFNQLENAVNVLKKANLTGEQKNALAFFDKIGEGNIANWIKFANTLRLRMAMHIKKADPEKARAVAEAAVKDGVLEKNDKDIEFAIPAGDQNPLFTISDSWNDTRLNANFEIILKRLGNPLLEVLFEDNSAPLEDKNGKMTL
ncbi:MAG: SusD/RagB family nutrient-binding outer membrane lipoprotein, partial [Candidatus Symbiothrix sp.]|nr:SusD/RagB family nutrient-binding outer membrane lipoprotein [Candidatus Symbiothrix sp.]